MKRKRRKRCEYRWHASQNPAAVPGVRRARRCLADRGGNSGRFFGILPRRLDGVAALVPGILVFETGERGEQIVAVDEGVLVKAGRDVMVSVRNAVGGNDLGQLRDTVEREFLNLGERERAVRSVLAKLETSFVRRMLELRHE